MNGAPKIDYLIVANHAEAVNGLLYLTGGGFTDVYIPVKETASFLFHFSAAISIFFPWESIGQKHTFTVRVLNPESEEVLGSTEASFVISKPLNIMEGAEQHVVGVAQFNLTFSTPGLYQVMAFLDNGDDKKLWNFRVHEGGTGT